MTFKHSLLLISLCFLLSCNNSGSSNSNTDNPPIFQNTAHRLIYEMTQKTGNYQTLQNKKDVVYTYTYETPDGKKDVSTEKYIFDGELSMGEYKIHERNLPQLEGTITQGYDGKNFWLRHNGEYLQDETMMKRVTFNRKTNFYWFAMFQKLLDPGLTYEHVREETIGNDKYDVVKITFISENEKPTDIYQLYINRNTKLVDQFLFTVVDFNVVEKPMLMKMEYEKLDGLFIPSKRKYKSSTWDAYDDTEPWIKVTWSDIEFDNGLTRDDFGMR